jgi:phosphoribosylformimino-5-aminoimidazole carboxamide ribotide isomerase
MAVSAKLYPAIDLLDGKVVRLSRGDYDAVTVYNEDPLAQARLFKQAGADYLHVVDLDAARGGDKNNRQVITSLIAESGLNLQVGGGVRDMAAIEWLVNAGAKRVILGTALITDEALVDAAILQYDSYLCAAIDARDGKVAISAWTETSTVDALELAANLASRGIKHYLYTDINRDGLQTGIDIEAYRNMAQATSCPVIISGGVASLDDLRAVKSLGSLAEAVIVGRALYENNFSTQQALEILEEKI